MDQLNKYAAHLVSLFRPDGRRSGRGAMSVSPIVSEVAVWYEKLRNAMEFREEEMVLRATIERILRRRLIFGGSGAAVAEPLIRELLWARYFTEEKVSKEIVHEVSGAIDIFLKIRARVLATNVVSRSEADDCTYHLLSSHIERLLGTNPRREAMVNFMYHVVRRNISLEDEDSVVCDVQTYIAVRRAFAKNDLALLRYHLFLQYFGEVKESNIDDIVSKFEEGFKTIESQLSHPLRYRFHSYIKRLTPPFFILYEVLSQERLDEVLSSREALEKSVRERCQEKYKLIVSKVQRGVLRSVIFILLTKTFFALAIEGTYERAVYGSIQWVQVGLNIFIPTLLMVASGVFLRAPGDKNTDLIYQYITELLYEEDPQIGRPIRFSARGKRTISWMHALFTVLWFAGFVISFGGVIYLLRLLDFNFVSIGVFVFFFALVIFLAYRIRQTAKLYSVREESNILTPIADFFFMPFARVGRWITEGVSQVNILLIIIDYFIETPFKAIFGFFEQWFFFLSSKREQMD